MNRVLTFNVPNLPCCTILIWIIPISSAVYLWRIHIFHLGEIIEPYSLRITFVMSGCYQWHYSALWFYSSQVRNRRYVSTWSVAVAFSIFVKYIISLSCTQYVLHNNKNALYLKMDMCMVNVDIISCSLLTLLDILRCYFVSKIVL